MLLRNFGRSCFSGEELNPPPSFDDPAISIAGYDSGHYSSGDFKGEADDWVFDVMVEMDDTDDDWLGAGAKVTTANSATFRIVSGAGNPPIPGSGTPNRYRCFFSVPGDLGDSSHYDTPLSSGTVMGAYNPLDDVRIYSTSELNANWYDTAASDDGPAAILRIVIDINGVSGHAAAAFGDVYFTTGSPGSGDIKVADFDISVYHLGGGGTPATLTGSFYVID